MRVHTLLEYQWDGTQGEYVLVREEGFEYDGPVARCDRAAQSAFGKAAGQAGTAASQFQGEEQAENAALTPFYRQEMQAQHLYTPGQKSQLLSSVAAPLAASAATTAGQAASERARTRNTAGYSSALDQAARERQSALGQAGLDIGAQDIMGAKELNQEGAKGMQGLYGTDVSGMLGAMGRQNEALQGQVEAGKSGWFQNMTGMLNAIGNAGKGIGAMRGSG